jgi:hypothetical protein
MHLVFIDFWDKKCYIHKSVPIVRSKNNSLLARTGAVPMLEEIVCGLPKCILTTALPLICHTLIALRFFWRTCPVNTASLAWMVVMSAPGNVYDLVDKGVGLVRVLSIISPIVCFMALLHLEHHKSKTDKTRQ